MLDHALTQTIYMLEPTQPITATHLIEEDGPTPSRHVQNVLLDIIMKFYGFRFASDGSRVCRECSRLHTANYRNRIKGK